MKVLFVAAEAFPFAKTGGLADVVGSLPAALRRLGVDARVIMPCYGQDPHAYANMSRLQKVMVTLSWRYQYCELKRLDYRAVPFYFIENPYYFHRSGLYGFYDDAERFAFFCRAVLQSLSSLDFIPDILHCHDWHTGPVSVFLRSHYAADPLCRKIKTVFSIHNILYQGNFPREILEDLLELDESYFTVSALEFYGQVSFLKGGLVFSDYLTTVSPSYAQEIQQPGYGYGMEGILQQRSAQLRGIVNGIDRTAYNPATDPDIFVNYRSSLSKKQQNKLLLQEQLGLKKDGEVPLCAFINRMVEQKGVDLIVEGLAELLGTGIQLVFLGTGEERYTRFLAEQAGRFPGQLSVNIFFDESLARKIYAGADFFLMPSLFEPCGTGQLIALRYGAIPVVRETGGLKDTIRNYDEAAGTGNGFTFKHYATYDMINTVKRALAVYRNHDAWKTLVCGAMQEDHGWEASAQQYLDLYRQLVG